MTNCIILPLKNIRLSEGIRDEKLALGFCIRNSNEFDLKFEIVSFVSGKDDMLNFMKI